jgi:ribosome maturation factor RimP
VDREVLRFELEKIIAGLLQEKGLELVELIYRYEGRDLYLRVLADRPDGGITLEECTVLNQEISRILDEKDILQQRYILEVSSPGADRPLRARADFLRCLKRKVRLFLNEPVEGKLELEGIIDKVEEDSLYLNGQALPLSKINMGKQIL